MKMFTVPRVKSRVLCIYNYICIGLRNGRIHEQVKTVYLSGGSRDNFFLFCSLVLLCCLYNKCNKMRNFK